MPSEVARKTAVRGKGAWLARSLAFAGATGLAFVGGGLILRSDGNAVSIIGGLIFLGAAIFTYQASRSPEVFLRIGASSANVLLLVMTSGATGHPTPALDTFVRIVWASVILSCVGLLLHRRAQREIDGE